MREPRENWVASKIGTELASERAVGKEIGQRDETEKPTVYKSNPLPLGLNDHGKLRFCWDIGSNLPNSRRCSR